MQNELFLIGKVMYHSTNSAWILNVWIYNIEKEHKFQTKALFDISINEIKDVVKEDTPFD
jgi:hypothetical protein